MSRQLTVIRTEDTPAVRAVALMAQARQNANEHIDMVLLKSAELQALLIDVQGDAYPAGVRDVCARLVHEIQSRADTVRAITGRVS